MVAIIYIKWHILLYYFFKFKLSKWPLSLQAHLWTVLIVTTYKCAFYYPQDRLYVCCAYVCKIFKDF